MSELAKYRVKIAAEVELGADDNLLEGTEVTVEAFSPQLAMMVACQQAIPALVEQMGVLPSELMRQMSVQLSDTMKQVMEAFGVEEEDDDSGDVPDASAPPVVMPLCQCGHRYDHHDHNPVGDGCHIEGCDCMVYLARLEVGDL